MIGLPIRLLLFVVVNLLLAPRNLLRALRRRPVWLTVRLDGALPERPPRRRLPFQRTKDVSVAGLVELARTVAHDPRVLGVVLEIDRVEAGWARLESLRAAVGSLRAAGKRVVAHLSSPGNKEYYLACAADEVLADESGPVGLTGLLIESGFYGEALRRLGIDPELDRMGDYKSFAETFTRADMSPATREALDAILDGIERRLLSAIAGGRKVDAERARALVDGGPYLVGDALSAGLLDGVCYRDQLAARLGDGEKRPANRVDHHAWVASRPRWFGAGLRRKRVIAVLSLDGAIVPGEGSDLVQKSCGAESAGRAIAALREARQVAAVVLHVDSRGGSAAASDRIWREVARLGEKKPVVAYLGDVAASGGYYIAAPCAWIVAQGTTLTGSIGVVAGKIAVERLLERLGVGTVLLARGRAAAMTSPRRRYDDDGKARLRLEIEGVYRQFVERVAAGRKLPSEEVEKVARGRVWIGEDGAARNLVDQVGGLADAVAAAEERARRQDGERFQVRDVVPHSRKSGLLQLVLTGGLGDALEPLRALARERALLVADDVPDVH